MAVFEISNLKCGGCATTIKKGIEAIEGINEVVVNLNTSEVSVDTTDESVINLVKEKLSSMGYPEVGYANTVLHRAKSFVGCATGRKASEE
jgi:copper chaperone CopZ